MLFFFRRSEPGEKALPCYIFKVFSHYDLLGIGSPRPGRFFRKAVDDLLSHYPVSLLILSGPIFEKDNNELKGCANIRHGHAAPSESTFLTYNWLFEFSMYIRQRHPNVKLGITAKTYGVDQPDYACWQHFDFFVP